MFSHASVTIWYFNNRPIFIFFREILPIAPNEVSDLSMLSQVALYYYSKVPKHGLLLFHIILYSFSLWLNFSFSCLSNGSKDFPLKELLIPSFLFSHWWSNQKFIDFFPLCCFLTEAAFLLRLFRKRYSWSKYSKLHLFQFRWNRKHSILELKSKVHPNLSKLFELFLLFQLFHSLGRNR